MRCQNAAIFHVVVFLTLSSLTLLGGPGYAQEISYITSSGLDTTVTQNGPVYNITGGTRPNGGPNLFHSFGEFGVPTNNIANFLNTPVNGSLPATSNILGRVTGGNISNIFGTIQTTGYGNANLFLMNPTGFLFGPNATLNVGGMVAFTSADYLKLTDDTRFNAIPNAAADALLTALPVASFGFLGSNPGAITVQGSQFSVTDGQSISLVSGNISIESGTPEGGTAQPARLSAPNGNVLLASAASPGEFGAATLQPLPNVDVASFTSFGSIAVASGSSIDVSGASTVSIRGGQFVLSVNDAVLTTSQTPGLSETISLSPGSSVFTSNTGAEVGADIEITTEALQMDAAMVMSRSTGEGAGGALSITAQTIDLANGSQIANIAEGSGAGGAITIAAAESFTASGFDAEGTLGGVTTSVFDPNTGAPIVTSGIFTTTVSSGNGGVIALQAPSVMVDNSGTIATTTTHGGGGGNIDMDVNRLQLINGGQVLSSAGIDFSTFEIAGSGKGGDISISAGESVSITEGNLNLFNPSGISTTAFSSGRGGHITIASGDVFIEKGGLLSTSTFGEASAGNITLSASNAVSLNGTSELFGSSSIASDTMPFGEFSGDTGTVRVSASSLTLDDQAAIRTQTFGNGRASDITLDVNEFSAAGGSLVGTIGSGIGATGTVVVRAAEKISLLGSPLLDVNNPNQTRLINDQQGAGASGGILLEANDVFLAEGARIRNDYDGLSGAPSLSILAGTSITISNGSLVASRSLSGDIGPIEITAPFINLSDQARISAQTSGAGNSGPITLHGKIVNLTEGSSLTSSTTQGSGQGGSILVSTTDSVSLSGGSTIESNSFQSGPAGSIAIRAENLIELTGANTGLFTQAHGSGRGGDVNLVAGQSVAMTNGARISASSTSTGNAGNISINAGQQFDMRNSSVTTEAAQASGGNIGIQAIDQVRLVNSTISTSVLGGAGSGGNITIDPNVVVLQNSQVIAIAIQGAGGNITITTPLFLADSTSLVSASSQFGLNGTVTIQRPTSNLSGSLGPLTSKPSQAQSLLTQRCAALANGQASSFVVAGREQLPADPGGWLSGPIALAALGESLDTADAVASIPTVTAMAAHDTGTVSLRRLTPVEFLIANFADSEATGCHS